MKKIAIISENYENDGQALKFLLEKKFQRPTFEIVPVLKNRKGSNLSNLLKMEKLLNTERNRHSSIDFIIVALDLDSLPSDEIKIKKKLAWYKDFQKITKLKNDLFLMIFELESIILADIETFNKLYKTKINFKGNPLYQANPKEFLVEKTWKSSKKYIETATPEIFKELDFQKVYTNHKGEISFQSFIDKLEKSL